MRQQQDEPGRFSICSRQAAVVQRGHTKADIVADVLATAGFPDFGDQLKLLATSSLQKTHKLA
ncbi:hypothetical protein [Escherichia coli]|uniref:hypothetical protein n=1 Tax=Escherichia coli TaxID=562 RepID=UPI001C5A6112|nr:hypothetical protein [Escherichia coli]MBW4300299.1 hypothetical protein [Escherichia coli]